MPGDWQNKACRSKETLIGELVSLSRHLKRTPRLSDVKNPTIYYKVFGSWNNALREAGLPINKPRSPRIDARKQKRQMYRMSDGYFLESLRKLANLIGGRRPQGKDFESKEAVEAGIPALYSYIRRFGSLQRALELAGLERLPGKKDLQKKLREEKIHRGVEEAIKVLAAKPYVFTDQLKGWDISARLLREEVERRGVVVLRRVKVAALERALNMYYGVGEEKVAREQMRTLMGNRAFETFEKYASGGRCCEIARELGCSREWIRLTIKNGIRRFLRRLDGPCREPARDAGKHPGKTSWVRFRAKFSADGVPVLVLLRSGQNPHADRAGIQSMCVVAYGGQSRKGRFRYFSGSYQGGRCIGRRFRRHF
ncbi:MAG: homing endonuclease associated repeat-containing protein [Moorellaceae bacterium]